MVPSYPNGNQRDFQCCLIHTQIHTLLAHVLSLCEGQAANPFKQFIH